MTRDMTEGKPLTLILQFCIPMLIGNLFQQFYNMVDSMIVGKFVGVDALAAVGSTGAVNFLVIGFVTGCASGFAIPVAQRFGAGDYSAMRKHTANAFYISVIITVVMTTLTMIFTRDMLVLTKTPDDIIDYAYDYIIIIFGGIAVTMLYNILASILRALGDSRTPLIFLAIASLLNVALDFLFVVGLKMECAGAGWATVIAQAVSAVLCLIYMKRKYPILTFAKSELKPEGQCCGTLLKIGLPMAFQFSITAIGSIILQTAVNSLGSGIVAAVTAANKIQMIAMQPMETMGVTLATYGGQNLGAGKIPRIKQGIRESTIVTLIYSAAAFAAVALLGQYIALLFIDADQTAILGDVKTFLRINGMFYPVLAILFILRNSLQGLGYSLLPMMAGVCELAARTAVAFLLVGHFGYMAICIASPTAWIAAVILLCLTYFSKMKKLYSDYNANRQSVSA